MAREAEADKRKTGSTSTHPPVGGNPLQGFIYDIQGAKANITSPKINTIHPEGSIPIFVQSGASRPVQIPISQDNYVDLSQKYEEDDHMGIVQESKPASHPAAIIRETMVDDKYKILEERLKVVKGFNVFEVDALGMCLVPDVVIPPKFKTYEFKKYKGVCFPKNHLRMFVKKMATYTPNEKLMIHSFQDNLSRASLNWYMQLERTHIKTWEDLDNTFLRHYKYNLDMNPNRMQL